MSSPRKAGFYEKKFAGGQQNSLQRRVRCFMQSPHGAVGSDRARWLNAAVPLLLLSVLCLFTGCEVDTQTYTVIGPDGAVDRTIAFELNGLDRTKEADAFPAKTYLLPAAPGWELTENPGKRLAAKVRCAPGQPIPGGCDRHLLALDRKAMNGVKVEVRDHFISTSYAFEERYEDTVKADEFKSVLLAEFDRESSRLMERAQTEFGATHDVGPMKLYVEESLRGLIASSADRVARSGLYSGLFTLVLRLGLGGFSIKNVDDLFNADPRAVIRSLFSFCLGKMRLKPERMSKEDEEKVEALVRALSSGSLDERTSARKEVLTLGTRVLPRLDEAERRAREQKADGEALRLSEASQAIRAGLQERVDALVERLAKETEQAYLHPAEERRGEVEKRLALILGAHIEANFAPCEYTFLCRVKLPGELAWKDPHARVLSDGTIRWNFTAVNFFIQPKLCGARSRIWQQEQIKALGTALFQDPDGLTLRMREGIDDALAKLDGPSLGELAAVLKQCVEARSSAPLKARAQAAGEANVVATAARELLKIVTR